MYAVPNGKKEYMNQDIAGTPSMTKSGESDRHECLDGYSESVRELFASILTLWSAEIVRMIDSSASKINQ